jgi:hypothetical protein
MDTYKSYPRVRTEITLILDPQCFVFLYEHIFFVSGWQYTPRPGNYIIFVYSVRYNVYLVCFFSEVTSRNFRTNLPY